MNAPRIDIDGSARVQELLQSLLPSKDIGSFVGGRVLPGTGETVELDGARLEVLADDDTPISQVAVRSAPRLPHKTD